jgi:hypothetical protein
MSRGFEIDDFRDAAWQSDPQRERYARETFGFGREPGRERGGSNGDAQSRSRLEQFREAESHSDRTKSRNTHQENNHPGPDRESQGLPRLQYRQRAQYRERDRTYSLRPSEIHTLTEVGKFRVVSVKDLAEFAYNGDRSRMECDLRNLLQQDLVERRGTSAFKKESRQILTLTKRAQHLIRQRGFVPEGQAIYSGLVKPKEAEHDAALYRLYLRAAAEIESKGGKVLRVQLDYDLKEQLYRKLGRAKVQDKNEALHFKNGFAQQLYLPVVDGKVSFPDLRIEYANQDMEISRVDLDLGTGHYHAGHLAEKARAGFQIYARSEDAPGLRRVRDEREIMTSILSL